jgi:hypothetical protein
MWSAPAMRKNLFLEIITSCLLFPLLSFNGCTGDGSDNGVDTYYYVTVTTSEGGYVRSSSGDKITASLKVPVDDNTTITAVANEGYRFSSWTGDISSTDNPVTFTVNDDMAVQANFVVSVGNTAPVAYDIAATTTEDTSCNIQLKAEDVDGNNLTFSKVTSPSHGTVTVSSNLATYTPTSGYIGPDSFTYMANDGLANSNTATVNITVTESSTLGWARTFGSSGADSVKNMAMDSNGYLYVVGYFSDTVDFDPGVVSVVCESKGGTDMFLAKYAPDATLQWVITLGSSQNDEAAAIAVETTGNVYAVGNFRGSLSFKDTSGITSSFTSQGGTDGLIAKFSSLGVHIWSKQIGGSGDDQITCVAPNNDPSKNIILGGSFSGTVDFDTDSYTSNGGTDGFVTKLSTLGEFVWTARFGGSSDDEVRTVACDDTYNLRIAGNFSSGSIDLNPDSAGSDTQSSKGGQDIFVVKLSTLGVYAWGKVLGGTSDDAVRGLTCDTYGTAYLGGYFQGTASFGTTTCTSGGGKDGFIYSVNSSGTYQWTRTISGTGDQQVNRLATLSTSNVVAAGTFAGTADFDPNLSNDTITAAGSKDGFLTKITVSGGYVYTRSVGGSSSTTTATAVAVNSTSYSIYWGGDFQETADLDPESSTEEEHTSSGNEDCYMIKMSSNGSW